MGTKVSIKWRDPTAGHRGDSAEPVELQRACTQSARCPRGQQYPLTADDNL